MSSGHIDFLKRKGVTGVHATLLPGTSLRLLDDAGNLVATTFDRRTP
jgi:hypothetical protein